jgi:hypothetical protein
LFGMPVLVSASRKSFLRALTGRDAAGSGPATLAAEIFAAAQGAAYLRTHDVAAVHDALTVLTALDGAAPEVPAGYAALASVRGAAPTEAAARAGTGPGSPGPSPAVPVR